MSNIVTLKGYKRESVGSAASRRLRREGFIPAVIYGKHDPVHLALEAKEFSTEIKSISESNIIGVKLGRKSYQVLIKDYQEALLTNDLMHIDLYEVIKGESLHTEVAVILKGTSKGVKEGGLLEHVMHAIEIECLPKDIPESFVVDITDIGLNESLHVRDLTIPEGVKVLVNEDRTVVTVVSKKSEASETAEEEAEEEVEVE